MQDFGFFDFAPPLAPNSWMEPAPLGRRGLMLFCTGVASIGNETTVNPFGLGVGVVWRFSYQDQLYKVPEPSITATRESRRGEDYKTP